MIDGYFKNEDTALLEKEISMIVDKLWDNCGERGNFLKPLGISHLNIT